MALTDSLVAHWRLDEASGTRVDVTGRGNDLAATGAPGSAAGKIVDAVSLNGSSQYLSVADNADTSVGNLDFAFAMWVYLASTAASGMIVCKGTIGGGAATEEYRILYSTGVPGFRFVLSDGAALTTLNSTFGAPTTGVWYFVVGQYDAAANLMRLSVNDGAVDTAAQTTGGVNGAAAFTVGAQSGGVSVYLNGRVDSLSIWKRVLTVAEITLLYNGGAGLDYPFGGKGLPVIAHHWHSVYGGGV